MFGREILREADISNARRYMQFQPREIARNPLIAVMRRSRTDDFRDLREGIQVMPFFEEYISEFRARDFGLALDLPAHPSARFLVSVATKTLGKANEAHREISRVCKIFDSRRIRFRGRASRITHFSQVLGLREREAPTDSPEVVDMTYADRLRTNLFLSETAFEKLGVVSAERITLRSGPPAA